jgi:type IV pilus biogenesis protein CpaD/CtpE
MRTVLAVIALVVMAGCASARVNVDLDSCETRGQIDGIRVGSCQPVKVVR